MGLLGGQFLLGGQPPTPAQPASTSSGGGVVYDLALGADGDIFLGPTGDLATTSPNLAGIAQHIAQRLRLFQGELAWAPQDGVPYFQVILVKNPNPNAIRAAIAAVIKGTPGVKSLDRLDMQLDKPSRSVTIGFSVTTDAGLLNSTVTLTP